MTVLDELNDEEKAMLVFVKQRLAETGMINALEVVNEAINLFEVRAILNFYRDAYERDGKQEELK